MKIVVLDAFTECHGELTWESIEKLGELTVFERTAYDDKEIIEHIGDADIVVTGDIPVSAAVMDACPNIKFITVMGTGYNLVDCDYAAEKGIYVSNIPSYGTAAVGQYAISLLLEICGHVGYHSNEVKKGRWVECPDYCFWDRPLIELDGKTMGIIGFGRIGQTTGRVAKALGMRVIAYSRSIREEARELAEYVELDTLLRESDVIALHCPLFPETEGIINRDTIAKMKDGVIIINNSRGRLIVEQDLADALNSGKVYAAGLDVVAVEPMQADNPLLTAKHCYITPHISWAPIEARQRIMDCTEKNISAFLSGKPVNVVNGL